MCGIAGWVSFEEDVREKRAALEAMSAAVSRRGPDDQGMYLTPAAGLAHRRLSVRRYWDLQARPHAEGRGETIEHVRFLVEDAVRRQLVSDVPLCTMLSGGLDSSILSALAAEEYRRRGEPLHTWSVDYAESSWYFQAGRFVPSEDAPFAAQMAEHIGSNHHIVTIDNEELADALGPKGHHEHGVRTGNAGSLCRRADCGIRI